MSENSGKYTENFKYFFKMDFINEIKNWLELKIRLWTKKDEVVFKQGEIWWCSLGFNLGEEIFGKGEKFTANSFMGLPLTTHGKNGSWYVEIETKGFKRWALLNQARILDKKRLTNKIDSINKADFGKVKKRFIEFYSS